ncbi:MAG: hypothetical protein ABI091_05700 [Ferruginibacter sp.]
MTKVIWVIPEDKMRRFDAEYQKMIETIPKELWEDKNYMPSWDSELPFPLFSRSFTKGLPNEYREHIRNIFNRIIKDHP